MIDIGQAIEYLTLLGIAGSTIVALWHIFKFANRFLQEQEKIKDCLSMIKKEVQPNGGSSMKDTINGLKISIDRIEIRQQVIDQRTKAGLHYKSQPLFEINNSGNIVWYNEAFKKLTEESGTIEGRDWFSLIEENFRPNFIEEVNSCLRMGRKIDIDTVSQNGKFIHFVGYPYKIENDTHEGFLVHLYLGERK